MIIDEKRANVLTKYVTLKGVRVKSESDHNPLFAEFSLSFSRKQSVTRCEMFIKIIQCIVNIVALVTAV